jgi:hypothetical protein
MKRWMVCPLLRKADLNIIYKRYILNNRAHYYSVSEAKGGVHCTVHTFELLYE